MDKICHRNETKEPLNVVDSHGQFKHHRGSSPGVAGDYGTEEGRNNRHGEKESESPGINNPR